MDKLSCKSKFKLISVLCSICFLCGCLIWVTIVLFTTYDSCTITAVLHRECYEKDANYYFNQFIEINGNRKGFIECGKVINCVTSPCNFEYKIGDSYFCGLSTSNLYLVPDSPLSWIIISICGLFACTYVLTIIIVFRMPEVWTLLHFYESTKAIDESSILVNGKTQSYH